MRLSARVHGEGIPVLLLHGLLGSAASWGQVPALLAGCKVILPDLLGFGNSPKPDAAYDLATHGDSLSELVLENDPVCVGGHSMGAVIALELLRRHSSIKSAVLVSPSVFASQAEGRREMQKGAFLERLFITNRTLGRVSCEIVCALRPAIRVIAPLAMPWLPTTEARAKAGVDHTWTSYSRSLESVVFAGLVPGLMEAVGGRVAIMHGTADHTVPPELVRRVAHRARSFELVPGDHYLPLRNPKLVAESIASAVRRRSPQGVKPALPGGEATSLNRQP